MFFPVFQLRVYIYINILIQTIFITLSNTVHYFSRPTITAKLFIKLKAKLQYPQFYSSKTFAIKLCRWKTNAPTNKHKRSLHNSCKHIFNFNAIPLFVKLFHLCN